MMRPATPLDIPNDISNTDLSFSLATPEDLTDIASLHGKIFKRQNLDQVYARYEWGLFRNPAGPPAIVLARTRDHKLIGMYGTIPISLYLQGKETPLHLACASATHPQKRNHGIYTDLYRVYQQYSVRHLTPALLFGFPNQEAYSIARKKFGYRTHFRIHEYQISGFRCSYDFPKKNSTSGSQVFHRAIRKALRYLPYQRRLMSLSNDTSISIEAVEDIPEAYDQWWEQSHPEFSFIFSRNREFLRWRFLEEPYSNNTLHMIYHKAKLIGYVVASGSREIHIRDLCFQRSSMPVAKFMNALLSYFDKKYRFHSLSIPIHDFDIETYLYRHKPSVVYGSAFGIHPLEESKRTVEYEKFVSCMPYITGFTFHLG